MTLKQIRNHLRVFRMCYVKAPKSIFGLTITSILTVIFTLLYNLYSGKVIDSALSIASSHGDFSLIFIPLAVFMGLLFLTTISENIKNFFEVIYNNTIDLIADDYKTNKNLSLDPQTYIDPGFTAKRTIVDWNAWKVTGSSKTLIDLATAIIPSILYLFVLLSFDWRIGLLTTLSSIPVIIANTRFGKRVWAIWDDNSGQKIVWNTYRNSFWGDITDLKLLGAGKYLVEKMLKLHRLFLEKINTNEKNRLVSILWTSGIEYLFLIFAYVLLFQGVIDKSFTVGAFFVITASLWSVKREMGSCFESISVLESNASFIDDFITYMDWEPVVKSIPNAINLTKDEPFSIEFRDVWFKYPRTDKWIFKGINFTITKDEDVALVGKNGAGKTTLVKLITRIYDPSKGQILINGIPLTDINLKGYYKMIGLLNQNFRVYEFSAKENIFIGDTQKEISDSEVEKYAKLAQAHEFITELKKGYETYLTNDIPEGQELSGGQKQRLAIARVFYREPKLLILDEPTSAVDAFAEEEIFNNIFEYSENRTIIIVSHRFATVRKAKRIIVIDEGKIVEDGRHDQLICKNGLYKKMFDAQSID